MTSKHAWRQLRLGDLGSFRNGVNFGRDQMGDGVRLINVKDIFSSGRFIDFDSLDRVSIDSQKASTYNVERNDLFFVRSSVKRDGIGLVSMSQESRDDVVYCGFVIRFRLLGNEVDPLFLTYLLRSPHYRDVIRGVSGGAAIVNISQGTLGDLKLRIPTLSMQVRIAAIISSYDDLIENNIRRIRVLEEMARLIYGEWFVKLRFPGHRKSKLVNSELGRLPHRWHASRVGDAVLTTGGGTPSTKNSEFWQGGDVNWFTPSDLTRADAMFISESSKKITQAGLEGSSATLFPAYSVMMTSRATIGVVSINTAPACTNQGFITCVPTESLSVYQLYFWIKDNREKITAIASGATFKEISRSEFRDLLIVVPEKDVTKAFVQCVEPICKEIENLLVRNANLREARDFLAPRLISGEIDVENLDIVMRSEDGMALSASI